MNRLSPRYLTPSIQKDINKKTVLLGGPRQVGKTTLAKSISTNTYYLNYDITKDREIIRSQSWSKDCEILVLDELHKMPKWKSYLKGITDDDSHKFKILVTGSAKLDTIKKVGDSLAGRYFYWKLHPFCIKELKNKIDPRTCLERLLNQSGFPEPFFAEPDFYPRWAKTHLDIILRQDLLDLGSVSDILSIESLIELLSERVGQITSYDSLAKDLNKAPNTIKQWITILENLFIIFRVTPFSKNVARSLLKSPKFFFYDTARVKGDVGVKFENLVACALIKEIDLVNDKQGSNLKLHYLRDKDGHEIDFAITDKNSIFELIEAKWGDDTLSSGFNYFNKVKENYHSKASQIVANIKKEKEYENGIKVLEASNYLANVDFSEYGKRLLVKLKS